jgi:hypothetical protein
MTPTAILKVVIEICSGENSSSMNSHLKLYTCYQLKSLCHILTPNPTERIADLTECNIVLNTLDE